MNGRRLTKRIPALLAAYAIALQALLSSIVMPVPLAAGAAAIADICSGVPGKGAPAAPGAPCPLQCCSLGFAGGDVAPPTDIIAVLAPIEIFVARLVPFELPEQAAPGFPKISRAPPNA